MKIAFTGHTNIEKAYYGKDFVYKEGKEYDQLAFQSIYDTIENFLKANCKSVPFNELVIISGAARGIDEIAACVAIKNNLKLILAIPNSIKWHKDRPNSKGIRAQAIYYDWILNYSKLEIHEIKKEYGTGHWCANFARNQFMVDVGDMVLSYKIYDSAGTDHCIKAAKKKGNYLGNIPDIVKGKK